MSNLPRRVVTCLLAGLAGGICSCRALDGLAAYDRLGRDLGVPAREAPGAARLDVVGGMPVVHLYGNPRERGGQYGRLMGPALRDLHQVIVGLLDDRTRETLLSYADDQEGCLSADVHDELTAMAAAAGVPYDELVALNVTPELACSGLAVWDVNAPPGRDPGMIMGRNGDYFSLGLFRDRGMLVRVVHPEHGAAVVGITFLGMVGSFTGMNEHGVAYGNMMVSNAARSQRREGGAPIQLALQAAAAEAASADQMAHRLCDAVHAIPMNVMISDARQALAVELMPDQALTRRETGGVLVTANHFLSPSLRTAPVRDDRFEILTALGNAHHSTFTLEEMKHALWQARRPVDNIQATIFEPALRRMHVAINRVPAAAGPYVRLDLTELLDQTERSQKTGSAE